MTEIPAEIRPDLRRAVRLEWWTIVWQSSIVAVMALVLSSSQAMKTAWIEDALGILPAVAFLIAVRFERRLPNRRFPFGFLRANSIAFLVSATALALTGGYLIVGSVSKLAAAEHPALGPITLFGETVWIGWLMMAVLAYSVVPPLVLGHLKSPLARRLSDKVLHTDSLMQKADWMTGLAALVGIGGVGFGIWWADAAAALVIACDIVHDGFRALKIAVAELIDGTPRALGSDEIAEDARRLEKALADRFPGGKVRLRETGRYIVAEITGTRAPEGPVRPADYWPGDPNRAWRFAELSFRP